MYTRKSTAKKTLNKDIPRGADSPPASAPRKIGEKTRIEVTPDQIRLRAYEIYEARNVAPGDALSVWMQAERELGECPDSNADPSIEVKVHAPRACMRPILLYDWYYLPTFRPQSITPAQRWF